MNQEYNEINESKKIDKKNQKLIILITISIICLLALIITSTYSVLVTRKSSEQKKLYKTGNLNIKLSEDETSYINISNSLPISDEIGKSQKAYTFTISSNVDNNYYSKYTIKLVPQEDSKIPLDNIKIQINDNDPVLFSSLQDYIIDSGYLEKNESKDYEIRMWIDINATTNIEGKIFNAKLSAEGKAVRSIETK